MEERGHHRLDFLVTTTNTSNKYFTYLTSYTSSVHASAASPAPSMTGASPCTAEEEDTE
jgi:hypothetical protein